MKQQPPPILAKKLAWSDVALARIAMPKGEMILTRSLTSGLTRNRRSAPDIFWGVGDRGPNISPKEAVERYGLTGLADKRDMDGAKVMPMPETGPAIARFRLVGDGVVLEEVIPLKTPDGKQLGGLPPSLPAEMESEPIFGIDGTRLGPDVDGADCEGIAVRDDGRFWVAEEYGPSLLLVEPDGTVIKRLVPEGLEKVYQGSTIPTEANLPAIAAARKLNRGFEALTLSPDGRVLYAGFQSPLAHPDREAHEQGDVARIWALDAVSGAFIESYAYPLDPPESFVRDRLAGEVTRSDIKVSELHCLPDGSLLVLERVTFSTKIYHVDIKDMALPLTLNDAAYRPTLEQMGQVGVMEAELPLLSKNLILSTDDERAISADLEGLLVLDDGSLLLANDSDYGTSGASTEFWLVQVQV